MDYLKKKLEPMLNLIEKLVNIDSGSTNKVGVDKIGKILIEEYKQMDFTIEVKENKEFGNNILIKHKEAMKPEILLIAHMDTVFPIGTAAERPFTIKNGLAFGPGVADMKASQVTLLYAMKYLYEKKDAAMKNVIIILNSDEEIGSPTSRELIEEISKNVKYALVMEPARKDGSIVSSRRGGGRYTLHVHGRSAHSGVAPEEGRSAIEELAYKTIKLNHLTDHEQGISVSVGIVEGGDAVNMIPDSATGYVDVRVESDEQSLEIAKKIESICSVPDVPGTTIDLEGGITRPPMEPDEKNQKLLEIVKEVGNSFGLIVTDSHTGGGSDASFPSHLGVATIDGVGPIGGKLHNEGEYLEIDSLTERCFLLAETVSKLSESN
ncbi:M20 family metallopeptidase [Psychrobacillus sp. Sa2BUA9]|uniref:M20 family metallopeptidase n=1 Tax=Psychrobacillus faecigallinarum TaxID=2762235 RepID=A0ABR8R5Z4_9BACI|nr:M20 family metallopeptidase [Psychrobacillus faecigallinarum]MBD7943213.1 M20 family metallopeptidase [Psychrobacillus faecigallinarum]